MATSEPTDGLYGGKPKVRATEGVREQVGESQPVVAREQDKPVVAEEDLGFEEKFGFPSRWE